MLVGAGLVVQVRSVLVGAAQCWSGRVLLVVLLVRSVLVEVARCWYVCWSVILVSVAGLCWLWWYWSVVCCAACGSEDVGYCWLLVDAGRCYVN